MNARRALSLFLPVLIVVLCVLTLARSGRHDSDFATFYDAGRAVLHGHSPYPTIASLPSVAGKRFAPFVYPPVAAFSMAPLSVLPFDVAVAVYLLLAGGAVVLALRALGVSDRRCFATAFASPPVFAAIGIGTITPFLLLAAALAWRHRDRAAAAGLLVAYAVTAKLFLWPLWLWLVRTRRFAAAGIAAGTAAVAVAVSWAGIGLAGLTDYPRLLARMTELVGPKSYSVYAFARSVDAGNGTAEAAVYAATLVALVAALVFVKGDRESFVAAIGIALVATPILWPHYLVLLLLPVALLRRTFSPLWAALLLLWADAGGSSSGRPLAIAGVLVFVAAIVGLSTGGRIRLRPVGAEARSAAALPLIVVLALAIGVAAAGPAAAASQSVTVDIPPIGVAQGGLQHIRAIVVGNPTCTLSVRYANGAVQRLGARRVTAWRVQWAWRVGRTAPAGRASATVLCGAAGRAQASFVVRAAG